MENTHVQTRELQQGISQPDTNNKSVLVSGVSVGPPPRRHRLSLAPPLGPVRFLSPGVFKREWGNGLQYGMMIDDVWGCPSATTGCFLSLNSRKGWPKWH